MRRYVTETLPLPPTATLSTGCILRVDKPLSEWVQTANLPSWNSTLRFIFQNDFTFFPRSRALRDVNPLILSPPPNDDWYALSASPISCPGFTFIPSMVLYSPGADQIHVGDGTQMPERTLSRSLQSAKLIAKKNPGKAHHIARIYIR